MKTRIIYHDFQHKDLAPLAHQPESSVLLTAAALAKGRRIAKINQSLNVICVALCGACIGVSSMILCILFGLFG